jgi:hypothetical protein
MKDQLPPDVEKLLNQLFTLIGESLIDEEIDNREPFEKIQNEIGVILKKYNVPVK